MKTAICLAALTFATFGATHAFAADADSDTDSASDAPAKDTPPAKADAKSDEKSEAAKPEADSSYGHARQFGVRLGFVGGYNMIFRYDSSPLCATYDGSKQLKDQQKFCGHGAPPALDVAVSFAPLNFVEPYAFGRFGLKAEVETDTKPLVVLGAGVRIYTMSDSAFKIFVDPAVAYEFEGGQGTAAFALNNPAYNPSYKKDLLFHLAAGPQFDLAKYVGIYADAGLTTGILRSIHTELELQLGAQARFP